MNTLKNSLFIPTARFENRTLTRYEYNLGWRYARASGQRLRLIAEQSDVYHDARDKKHGPPQDLLAAIERMYSLSVAIDQANFRMQSAKTWLDMDNLQTGWSMALGGQSFRIREDS